MHESESWLFGPGNFLIVIFLALTGAQGSTICLCPTVLVYSPNLSNLSQLCEELSQIYKLLTSLFSQSLKYFVLFIHPPQCNHLNVKTNGVPIEPAIGSSSNPLKVTHSDTGLQFNNN